VASGITAQVGIELQDGGVVGWVMWDMFGAESEVDGVLIPDRFYLRFPGSTDQPSLRIEYQVRDAQVVCTAVHLDGKSEGREIKSNDLEIVRRHLGDWTRIAVMRVMQFERVDESGRLARGIVTDTDSADAYRALSKKPKRRKITANHLKQVASLYTDNVDEKPWAAIAKHFDVSDATAGRYIVQARKAGYLPPTESGKKKA
jgi:hypothetical protein